MSEDQEVQPDDQYEDDDLRWFNEVYVKRFPNDTAMIADLDQQLARFRAEHPEGFDQDHDDMGR